MRYIDQSKIFEQTEQGYAVFAHYFPGENLRDPKKFFKIRPEEKSASARVSWYNGLWRITDFGNQGEINGMNAIEFVKWQEKLEYYDALQFIEKVIIGRTISGDDFVKSKFQADYEFREVGPDDKKGEYKFTFKQKPSSADLSSIGRYVTKEILEKFNCKVIEKYEYCSFSKSKNKDVVHIFKSNDTYPMFLFDYGDFKKLYRPLDREKKNRFLYIGEKPKNYIYGLKQLKATKTEFITDEDQEEPVKPPAEKPKALVKDLFRCSGESDALNLSSLGFHVYWLNSESAELSYDQFKELDDLCESHYQIMDLDATGRAQAMKNALKYISLFNVELPDWLRLKDDWRGNPCKDLKDFINISGDNQDMTFNNFTVLKCNARRVKFWYKEGDKKGDIQINMEYFFFFLRANGFYQMESIYHKKAGYCYAHITNGKMVELIHPDDMKRRVKRFTKDWIKSKNLKEGISILNKINTSAQLSEGNFDTIDEIKCSFKNYDRNTEYLHFNNCSIKITKDKIERVKHDQVPNYILRSLKMATETLSQLIDRNMQVVEKPPIEVKATPEYEALLTALDKADSDEKRANIYIDINKLPEIDRYQVTINDNDIFTQFIRDVTRIHWRKELEEKKELTPEEKKQEMLALANIMFMIGYHCAQYKDKGKPWVTWLQDMKISEVGKASGRSGKSLISMAPKYCRIHFYIGGRELNDKEQFKFLYDGLTEFHDYIEVDDFHEFGLFTFFYTQITGNRKINPKNYSAVTLSYEDSGKMLFSSNYEMPNMDNSTLARILNAGISDYYHEATKFNDYKETRTPLTKFGRRIYDDFTDEEWIKFYNFTAYCIQLQMRFYKIQPPMDNLEKRQMRRIMSQGLGRDEIFLNWANEYFIKTPEGSQTEISPDTFGYLNTYIVRETAFENFKQKCLTPNQRNEYKSTTFKTHLEAWCGYMNYTFNPLDKCTDPKARRILKSINSKTMECFFISTLPPSLEEDPENCNEVPETDLPF